MKLYKDYKEEQALLKKEQEDREKLGIPSEVTVIYEVTKGAAVLRKILNVIFFASCMGGLGIAVIAAIYYISIL